jgi:hypothetical protein
LLIGTLPKSQIGFQSAYGIFDYLNVGFIHNYTIFSYLSVDDLYQLRVLADEQELALVYNTSSPNRSIGGKTLSGAILSQLNKTVSGTDRNIKVTYFAASYSVFQAFFGLAGLLRADSDFYGLPDYASTMAFELRRPTGSSGNNKLFVRFGFRNGSSPTAELKSFPLFGRTQIEADISWSQFVGGMTTQSISSQADWCHACVNSNLTFCAAYPFNKTRSSARISGSGGVSPLSAGFIGAAAAVVVIPAIEALLVLAWFAWRRRCDKIANKEIMSDTASTKTMIA